MMFLRLAIKSWGIHGDRILMPIQASPLSLLADFLLACHALALN
jgi:hypothetical protein